MASSLFHCALVLTVPLLEVFLIRETFHYFFGRNNINFGFYSLDALLGCGLVFTVYFVMLDRSERIPIKFSRVAASLNLFALALLLAQAYSLQWQVVKINFYFPVLVLLLLSLFCFVSALTLFVSSKQWKRLVRTNAILSLTSLISISVLVIYPFLIGSKIDFLCPAIAKCVWFILKLFNYPVQLSVISAGWRIHHPRFPVFISAPCSGIEGMFFFTAIFFMFVCFQKENWRVSKFIIFYSIGLILMFVLNVFRISSFLMLSYFLMESSLKPHTVQTFSFLFHANVGWVLYSIGLYFYLKALSLRT